MGGHNAGEVASNLAIEAFIRYTHENTGLGISINELLIKGVQYANNVIVERSNEDQALTGMGTTLIICTISEDTIYVANVGDSRLYVYDNGLNQVSIDHSYVEDLVRIGQITRDESLTHPNRNIITRALGLSRDIEVDIFKLQQKNVSKILLCSDGLTNMVKDIRIDEIIQHYTNVDQIGKRLLEESLENGGTDNITCILIDVTL